jgi:hypothetical protein
MDLERIADVPQPVDEQAVQEEILAWLNDTPTPWHREPWRITSIAAADWAMRTVAEVRAREAQCQAESQAWLRAAQRVGHAAEWLEDQLRGWAIEQRTAKLKTQHLAHGTVATREAPARIEVVDEDAVIQWALTAAPTAVRMTAEFRKSEVGEAWRIAEVVVGYEAIHRETGEVETVWCADLGLDVAPFDAEVFTAAKQAMPDHSLTAIMEDRVLDANDGEVPGVRVEPAHVTATVRPMEVW